MDFFSLRTLHGKFFTPLHHYSTTRGFLKTFEGILYCISLIKGIHFHIRLIKEGSNILSVKGGLIDVVIRDRGGT